MHIKKITPHTGQFCAANPDDGICRPQKEFAITPEAIATALTQSDVAAEEAHAGDDHAISAVRAAFAMAPALVQALDPAGLAQGADAASLSFWATLIRLLLKPPMVS